MNDMPETPLEMLFASTKAGKNFPEEYKEMAKRYAGYIKEVHEHDVNPTHLDIVRICKWMSNMHSKMAALTQLFGEKHFVENPDLANRADAQG
jgi:hypothetical protein